MGKKLGKGWTKAIVSCMWKWPMEAKYSAKEQSQNTTQHSFIKEFSVDLIKYIFILLKYKLYCYNTSTAEMSVLFLIYLPCAFARVLPVFCTAALLLAWLTPFTRLCLLCILWWSKGPSLIVLFSSCWCSSPKTVIWIRFVKRLRAELPLIGE